jgi:hypothetical protein
MSALPAKDTRYSETDHLECAAVHMVICEFLALIPAASFLRVPYYDFLATRHSLAEKRLIGPQPTKILPELPLKECVLPVLRSGC